MGSPGLWRKAEDQAPKTPVVASCLCHEGVDDSGGICLIADASVRVHLDDIRPGTGLALNRLGKGCDKGHERLHALGFL